MKRGIQVWATKGDRMDKKDFDLLVESFQQAIAYKQGDKSSARSVVRTKADLAGRGLPLSLELEEDEE